MLLLVQYGLRRCHSARNELLACVSHAFCMIVQLLTPGRDDGLGGIIRALTKKYFYYMPEHRECADDILPGMTVPCHSFSNKCISQP